MTKSWCFSRCRINIQLKQCSFTKPGKCAHHTCLCNSGRLPSAVNTKGCKETAIRMCTFEGIMGISSLFRKSRAFWTPDKVVSRRQSGGGSGGFSSCRLSRRCHPTCWYIQGMLNLQPLTRPHLFRKSTFTVAILVFVFKALAVLGAVVAASADDIRRPAGTYGASSQRLSRSYSCLFSRRALSKSTGALSARDPRAGVGGVLLAAPSSAL